MFSTLHHVLVGLCIHRLPKFDTRMFPRRELMRRRAKKRAYTLTINILKWLDVLALHACMNACHKLSPCRPSKDHFLERAICWMKCWYYWRMNIDMWILTYEFLDNCWQIIRTLFEHRRATLGKSSALKVSMNSEKKGYTEVHMPTRIVGCTNQICACLRSRAVRCARR